MNKAAIRLHSSGSYNDHNFILLILILKKKFINNRIFFLLTKIVCPGDNLK